MKVAILIAVETYGDTTIRPVKYAEADARGLATALNQHGFDTRDQVILINGDATKTIIESRVRKTISSLAPDDTLYIGYAGHGFSKNGCNFITCYDTQMTDLEGTSIQLDWVFKLLRKSGCKRVAMFLDSCESGMLASADMRTLYGSLSDEELGDFFRQNEHCVCFAACKTGQESWPNRQVKHGAWTFHVIEALKGDAPSALVNGKYLTSNSLQSYLAIAVPKSLRTAYVDKKDQTPWFWGSSSGEFLVADLSEILARRKTAANPHSGQVMRVSLVREQVGDIRRLSGFRKSSHQVPDYISSRTKLFVAGIADDDIRADLDKMHGALRAAFGFKRIEVQVDGPNDGAGTIITPFFTYAVDAFQNPTAPSEVVWRRQVMDIKEPDKIFSDEFEIVFGRMFDTVEFSPPTSIDLTALIDKIEQMDDDKISIDYDTDAKSCTVKIKGLVCEIHVTAHSFEIVIANPEPPRQLLQAFFDIQHALIDTHEIRLISFDASETK
jgi:hypothetical protein